mgnify:CR=1 FL=1
METAFKTLDADRVFKRALKMVRSVCPDNIELKENINLPGVTIVGNETQLNQDDLKYWRQCHPCHWT